MCLVEIVKENLKFSELEIPCRLVECFITAAVLQKRGIDHQDETEVLESENDPEGNFSTSFQLLDIPEKILSLWNKQLRLVEDFVNMKLGVRPIQYTTAPSWIEELRVSSC